MSVAKERGKRDLAIALFLLDTGVRESELCAIDWLDMDLTNRRPTIRDGKGGKSRSVFWSAETGRLIWAYIQEQGGTHPDAEPVFVAQSGGNKGGRMTRSGLYQLCRRWGKTAEVKQCHPHTFRHTFATMFLLAGGNQMTLMDLMGHTNIKMTRRYVRFTGADLAGQARQFSPVAHLRKGMK